MSHTPGFVEGGAPIPVGELVGRLARQTFLFGPGAAGARLGAELDRMGWNRVVVVASRSSVRSGLVGRVEVSALAGRRVLGLHADARPHAPVADIELIAREVAGCRPQALVAIGGGSTIDTAKGVALLMHTGGRLCDQADAPPTTAPEDPSQASRIPLVAVPTTL